uniref:Uncharacterized protein n=1 Tax=Lygus hesperus TaxID=30085 RepID=A0A146LUJ9_LYGHE
MRMCCTNNCVRKILLPLCAYNMPTAKYAMCIVAKLICMIPFAARDVVSRDGVVLFVKLVKKGDITGEYRDILLQLLQCMHIALPLNQPHPEMTRPNSFFTTALISATKQP